jgi:CheY-like chemotaxis protein
MDQASAHPPPAAAAATPDLAGHAVRRRRALVVDDDALTRHALTKILRTSGFHVRTADDGLEGLRALVDEVLDLDVVVTDVRMPGIGGEELIRRIREAGGEKDLGIVVVTGAALDEARLCALGADAVVGKTAGVDAIVAAVDLAALRTARARAS